MTLSIWLVYVAAVLVLTVTPGPSVLLCISTAIQHGPQRALISSLGSTTAIACVMLLSMLGLGTALVASEALFVALKWLGAGYLAYLGVTLLFSKASTIKIANNPLPEHGTRALFARGMLVGASNPKAILFFGALFPQFINPAEPQLLQLIVLGATFICFELFWLSIYACTASQARHWLQKPRSASAFNKITGIVFISAAALLVTSRRNSA